MCMEWKLVSNELPMSRTPVLVHSVKRNKTYIAEFNPRGYFETDLIAVYPTHWSWLPELPSE